MGRGILTSIICKLSFCSLWKEKSFVNGKTLGREISLLFSVLPISAAYIRYINYKEILDFNQSLSDQPNLNSMDFLS